MEKAPGGWWAVAQDVADALGYKHTPHMIRMLDNKDRGVHEVDSTSDSPKAREKQKMTIISEYGIYDAIWAFSRQHIAI